MCELVHDDVDKSFTFTSLSANDLPTLRINFIPVSVPICLVKNTHGTTPFECVADGKSAIRWVRANAERLGVNPDKIVAGGGSAGGHVAACEVGEELNRADTIT